MSPPLPRGAVARRVLRLGSDAASTEDAVVLEEPLEIRIQGEPVAVTMRTPGHDRALTAGFLFTEGLLTGVDEIGSMYPCGRVGEEGFGNVFDVIPAPGSALDPERLAISRRGTLTTASCGVCGRRSIDDLLARCAPLQDESRFEPEAIARAFEALRERQALFRHTGGLHAAGIFRADGSAWAVYEDIGRHNAVDKAIGQLVLENALPASGTLLAVSGRASFEMVQKAVVAGIPVIASVSAASSLAIDLAARARATLLAFVRDGRMNIYAGEERIR